MLDCVTSRGLEVAFAKDLKELRSGLFRLFIRLVCVCVCVWVGVGGCVDVGVCVCVYGDTVCCFVVTSS
jgi:hypothetical protein